MRSQQLENIQVGQEVAVFSNNGVFQSWYHIESISPKGTKIVIKRGDDYRRTFNNKNIEQNGYSTKYRSDYIRTDVQQVRHEIKETELRKEVVAIFDKIRLPQNYNHYMNKEALSTVITQIEQQLVLAKQAIEKLTD